MISLSFCVGLPTRCHINFWSLLSDSRVLEVSHSQEEPTTLFWLLLQLLFLACTLTSFCFLCAGYENWRELAKALAGTNVPGGDPSLPFYYRQKMGHQVRRLGMSSEHLGGQAFLSHVGPTRQLSLHEEKRACQRAKSELTHSSAGVQRLHCSQLSYFRHTQLQW